MLTLATGNALAPLGLRADDVGKRIAVSAASILLVVAGCERALAGQSQVDRISLAGAEVEVRFDPLGDASGDVVGAAIRGVARSDDKDERLTRSQARLAEAQRVAHVGSWDCDAIADVVTWSDESPRIVRPNGDRLLIGDEADKTRFGRELSLTDAARAALDRVCPEVGLIFGAHDYRNMLRDAARAAGLAQEKADRISAYDFRYSRLTAPGASTTNLVGMQFLAGHKHASTTAIYMHANQAAAVEVLASAGGFSSHFRPRDENRAGRSTVRAGDLLEFRRSAKGGGRTRTVLPTGT